MEKSKRNHSYIIAALLICSIFITFAEGVKPNWFTLWNLTPVAASYLLHYIALRNNSSVMRVGSIGFAFGCIGLSLFIHAAWLFDWGGTATGSSTAGLIFIFIPPFSLISGGIGFIIGGIIARFTKKT